MTERERNKYPLLLAGSLKKDERYDDLILLGNLLLDDTPSMRMSFKVMTHELTHPGIIEINNKITELNKSLIPSPPKDRIIREGEQPTKPNNPENE